MCVFFAVILDCAGLLYSVLCGAQLYVMLWTGRIISLVNMFQCIIFF